VRFGDDGREGISLALSTSAYASLCPSPHPGITCMMIHTAPQPPLVTAVLSTEHVHELARLRIFSGAEIPPGHLATDRPDPEPIPEEIVSSNAPQGAALVPAQSDLMACSKMRQTEAVGDSRELQYLRLWASTRTRQARIARADRLHMHMPARTKKCWQSGSKQFQQEPDANSSCPPQNKVACYFRWFAPRDVRTNSCAFLARWRTRSNSRT